MSVEQTLARWGEGKESWNAWAEELLARKARLIEADEWAANPFGEGENDATRAWLEDARADFSDQVFPENVHFAGYIFPGPVVFANCAFSGGATFDDVRFESGAVFTKARFEAAASFKRANFAGIADFDEAMFTADAAFEHAQFAMDSDGPLVIAARFSRCQFAGRTDFRETAFAGNAKFTRSGFDEGMRFDSASFQGAADFAGVCAKGIAAFAQARFAGDASFADAELQDEARFAEARFEGEASFERAEFEEGALFRGAVFADNASFNHAKFGGRAGFGACRFFAPVSFAATRFKDQADFATAHFTDARFHSARFRAPADFEGAAFAGDADFSGLRSDSALTLAETRFDGAPDFLNAQIKQPPRLENMGIKAPVRRFRRWGDGQRDPRPWLFRLMPVARDGLEAARFRQLRHLARAGLDHEREGAFYADELRAARFWRHKPLGRGAGRFWLGWLYGGTANFGRSILRPLGLWVVTTVLFALVYLGLRDTPAPTTTEAPFPAWPDTRSFQSMFDWLAGVGEWSFHMIANLYASGGCVTGDGSASGEALYLSFKNSLFFVPWESPLAAQRVYGCLYGLEGGAAVVPLAASVAALMQNVIGVVLLVLAALALRNMLKRG
ncbi:pentapeptide repeat-containing protein [Dichotomicrobium thermohalophilum]|nr:pentapeptide repeat-containing protein [Dichotomicrobium thermohalophilum]